jgi:hypothetical protein
MINNLVYYLKNFTYISYELLFIKLWICLD